MMKNARGQTSFSKKRVAEVSDTEEAEALDRRDLLKSAWGGGVFRKNRVIERRNGG